MKRVQLFEFEDQKWFPDSMRIALTKLIVVLHRFLGIGDVLATLIHEVSKKSGIKKVVDLGSGAGGAMPAIAEALRSSKDSSDIEFLLTDLYPNKDAIKAINAVNASNIHYSETAVNATELENAPEGIKTMVNSFHHMSPSNAKKILASAQRSKNPILIYEMAENKIPLALWWILLPLSLVIMIVMVLLMTPFVKGLTFYQLFFTYIIPVIPIAYAWDGQASMPRIYAFKDIEEMLSDIQSDDYEWTISPAKKENGKQLGYYVLGMPK